MAMRDLIPWRRQENAAPQIYREEERNPFVRLRREMDRVFDDFFRLPVLGGSLTSSLGSGIGWPSVEVKETDEEVRITAELPGLTERDVEITAERGVLTIRGEKKSEHQDRDPGWSERYYGPFERSVALPDGTDDAHSEATFRDGVLSIRMPKSQAVTGRRIPIATSGTKH